VVFTISRTSPEQIRSYLQNVSAALLRLLIRRLRIEAERQLAMTTIVVDFSRVLSLGDVTGVAAPPRR
jgi:hypothetical protein